eukprot:137260_1
MAAPKMELVFRQKGNTKMVFHGDLKYTEVSYGSESRQRYKCYVDGCNASIITHNQDTRNYEIQGMHNVNLMHRQFGIESKLKMDFIDEVTRKVAKTHVAPHDAYNKTARERPQDALILRGFRDAKQSAYHARSTSGYTLPQQTIDFASALFDNKLDGNYYSQKLQRKDFDPQNTTKEQMDEYTKRCGEFFLGDHKRQYMGSGQYIKEWNHYRDFVRCNNQLENKNGIINRLCGSHPFLFEFQYLLAQYYNDEYIAYDQFIKHGATNKRHKREILKNKLLIRAWDFIDKDKSMGYVNTKDEDIVVFMKYASIALKGNAAQIEKMLQRKMW